MSATSSRSSVSYTDLLSQVTSTYVTSLLSQPFIFMLEWEPVDQRTRRLPVNRHQPLDPEAPPSDSSTIQRTNLHRCEPPSATPGSTCQTARGKFPDTILPFRSSDQKLLFVSKPDTTSDLGGPRQLQRSLANSGDPSFLAVSSWSRIIVGHLLSGVRSPPGDSTSP